MLWEAAVEAQYRISDHSLSESHAGPIDIVVENIQFIDTVIVYF